VYPHTYDETRAEDDLLCTHGMGERGSMRDWNEEVQACKGEWWSRPPGGRSVVPLAWLSLPRRLNRLPPAPPSTGRCACVCAVVRVCARLQTCRRPPCK